MDSGERQLEHGETEVQRACANAFGSWLSPAWSVRRDHGRQVSVSPVAEDALFEQRAPNPVRRHSLRRRLKSTNNAPAPSAGPFWLRRGENVPVPTMQQTATYGYLALSNAVAVRLPYVGGQMHMLIILPDGEATLQQVEERLDPALWRALATAPRKWVRLFLPKFRLAPSAMDLEPPLRTLGVTGAFDEPRGSADLGRIAPRSEDEYLAIGSAVQKVFVEVAEEGTEAATVAGMGAEPFGGPANTPPPVVVRVNRPFLFAIQHAQSGACLFLGRVTDPR